MWPTDALLEQVLMHKGRAIEEASVAFEQVRPRLLRIAGRILGDPHEAEDVVQNAWLRWKSVETEIYSLPAWLTTTTTRLCLDRLRARIPVPVAVAQVDKAGPDPSEEIVLAETVGFALQLVLDRLSPTERIAFVLHESFGFDFQTIAAILERTPAATRKLASRARGKVKQLTTPPVEHERIADWAVVDAFLVAARTGDFTGLLALLAPDVVVVGDLAAVSLGTPTRLEGADQVAQFFNGAAKAALSVYVGDRPAAAWFHQGEAKVLFDFTIEEGLVKRLDFRADPLILQRIQRRQGPHQP